MIPGFPMALIGAWGDAARISLTLRLDESEREALTTFARQRPDLGNPKHLVEGEAPETFRLSMNFHRLPGGGGGSSGPDLPEPWWTYFRELNVGEGKRAGQFDFVPADRTTNGSPAPTLDPASFSDNARDNDRNLLIRNVLFGDHGFTFPPVMATLATADYLDYLSSRGAGETVGSFDAISDAFFNATGKRIKRPTANQMEPAGTEITVEAGPGVSHPLTGLSSGEIEFLSLALYMRRIASEGGVLIVDEPETHLHPGLQEALLDLLSTSAERTQIWLLTHSPNLVRAAKDSAVLHLLAASDTKDDQIRRSSDQTHRDLLGDLGVHPSEIQESSFLVIVEGQSDRDLLRVIFPSALVRSAIIPASGVRSVEEISANLADQDVAFIAVRDRDLLTDDQVSDLESGDSKLFVWPGRTIESEFLSPELLLAVAARSNPDRTLDDVTEKLYELAEQQRGTVLSQLVQSELRRRHAMPKGTPVTTDEFSNLYENRAECERQRLESMPGVLTGISDQLASGWNEHCFRLVDSKRMLGEFTSYAGFANRPVLIQHLVATIKDDASLMPKGLVSLQDRIEDLVAQ